MQATAPALAAAALVCVLPAEGQQPSPGAPLVPGQVIERVICLHDPTQSYALYLPSTYTPQHRWPTLYAFDPRARGELPVRLFRAAAERLGYVVVGSNNSRNGPWPPVVEAMNALWRDTHARLAIDPARIYATGMSGGNGPAVALATREGAGVVACAGAIAAGQVTPPQGPFAWVSVAGDADFNFDLNRNLVQDLLARGLVARLAVFAGVHSWPPEDVAGRALDFLHLSAMRSGRQARDEAFIEAYSRQSEAAARQLVAGGRAFSAAEEFAALSRELQGLRDVTAFAAEAQRLRDSPEARKERKRERALATKYEREIRGLLELRGRTEGAAPPPGPLETAGASEGADGGDAITAQMQLWSRLDRLSRDSETDDPDTRIVARRARDHFFIETYYAALDRRERRRFEAAASLLELCRRMQPKSPGTAYELARTHAASGDEKRALEALRQAEALGFAEPDRLQTDTEWTGLRADPGFRQILGRLQSEDKPER